MSEQNFFSYGDAESVLANYAAAIGAIMDVIPSAATEQNKLATVADVTSEDIATTVTGTAITVTDGTDARVQNIQIFGHTESGSSVGDNGLAVTLKGKNLFNINGEVNVNTVNNTTPPQNWTIDTSNKKNTVSGNVLTAYRNMMSTWPDGQVISVKAGQTYTLSFRLLESVYPAVVRVDYWNSSTSKLVYQVNWWDRKFDRQSITFVAQTNSILLGFGCGEGNTSASFTDIMLEENDELTDYEPYRLSTLSVTTGLPLRSNGDVKDDVNFTAGIVTKRIDTDGTVLATPTEVSLSSTEINAFRALKTYAGTINITATDSPTMNFSYLKNTDNGKAVAAVQDDVQKQINNKQDALTFDTTPTENSTNPVTSGGVYDAIQNAGGGSGNSYGDIKMTACSTAPSGWMICDGSAISRETYANLFSAIGTAYGTGNGSTTFNIPNFKGKTAFGYNSSNSKFNSLGKTGGAETVTLVANNLPTHTHPMGLVRIPQRSSSSGTIAVDYYCEMKGVGSGNLGVALNITQSSSTGNNTTTNTAVDKLSPYLTINYIIYTGVTT